MTPLPPLSDIERSILELWRNKNIFAASVAARKDGPPFVFYDGPPFATGLPHYGHIMQMANKDAVVRYKTMHGYNVTRRNGWDVHGLPVEYQLEKELNLHGGKPAIEAYGIEKFIEAARGIVLRYTSDWEATMERMGRWVDYTHPYTTMDNDYMESVWWAFKTLYDKGLIYEDFRVSPYCPRCGTVLSNFEVNQGYKDNVPDPSVYITLPLRNAPEAINKAELVVWTTTPWTLPANAAAAVKPQATYAVVAWQGRVLIIEESRISAVIDSDEHTVISTVLGKELIGLAYEPLFALTDDPKAYHVINGGEEISTEEGSGILHVAPAYGEFDFQLGRANDLPLVQTVNLDGTVKGGFELPGEGAFVKKADPLILQHLTDRQRLLKHETNFTHTYPFCWRCDTPLLYLPTTSWFVKVTALKDKLVAANKKIQWQPEHLRDGRFGKWLEGARDWAISRNRYWGAPVPVWECTACHAVKVIGSRQEIGLDATFDLHRPFIDGVTIACESCGHSMKRVPFVFDCWFESGSMPFAQHHYPFANQDVFNPEANIGYPADFIGEALDQTRGWFYTLLVLSVGLFDEASYNNVVVTGLILAPDGRKLSKKLNNYNEPAILFEQQGVDALRLFLFTATSLGEDYRFSDSAVADVKRRWIVPLLNVVTYYNLSQAEVDTTYDTQPHHAMLDRWIYARLAEVWHNITHAMDGDDHYSPYDLVQACRNFGPLIEDLSTWYVRLGRGRHDEAFTQTLGDALKIIAILFAPFLPFVTEYIYQSVRDSGEPESVHLLDYPDLTERRDGKLISEMVTVRTLVSHGREARAKAGIPLRQPLLEIQISHSIELGQTATDLIRQELQVDHVNLVQEFNPNYTQSGDVALNTTMNEILRQQGMANGLRRTIQDLRKQARLEPSDAAIVVVAGLSSEMSELLEKQLASTTLAPEGKGAVLAEGEFKLEDTIYPIQLFAKNA